MNKDIYVSHKKVTRIPMTRAAYNDYRDWPLPADENGDDEGYLVEYLDGGNPNHSEHEGYISWSPKEQFDNGYTKVLPNTSAGFGAAIVAMKLGKKVARRGWNGANMFLYYVPANSYPVERNVNSPIKGVFDNNMVPYRAYMALKTAQNDIATWSPSGSDALAEDWFVVE